MTAPPLKKDAAICHRKRRHPDELTARAAAMCAITRHENADRLYVYQCEHCNGWHLTRFNNGRKNMVTADNPVAATVGFY